MAETRAGSEPACMSILSSLRLSTRTVVQAERPVFAARDVVGRAPRTRRGGRSRETVLFLIGIALLAIHVLDDNFVQPERGMSPGDHVVSGLVPLALLGLAPARISTAATRRPPATRQRSGRSRSRAMSVARLRGRRSTSDA